MKNWLLNAKISPFTIYYNALTHFFVYFLQRPASQGKECEPLQGFSVPSDKGLLTDKRPWPGALAAHRAGLQAPHDGRRHRAARGTASRGGRVKAQ